MQQGFSLEQIEQETGCCKWQYYAATKEIERMNKGENMPTDTKPQADSKRKEALRDLLPKLATQYMGVGEVLRRINAPSGWFNENPDMKVEYQNAIDAPRLEKLEESLKTMILTSRSTDAAIAEMAGVPYVWIANCKQAIALIEQYRQSAPDVPPAIPTVASCNSTCGNEKQAYEDRIKELEQKIAQLVAEIEAGKIQSASKDTISAQLAACRGNMATLNGEIAALRKEAEKFKAESASARTELDALKLTYAELVRNRDDAETLRAEVARLREVNNQLKAQANPRAIINLRIRELSESVKQSQELLAAAKLLQESDLFPVDGQN